MDSARSCGPSGAALWREIDIGWQSGASGHPANAHIRRSTHPIRRPHAPPTREPCHARVQRRDSRTSLRQQRGRHGARAAILSRRVWLALQRVGTAGFLDDRHGRERTGHTAWLTAATSHAHRRRTHAGLRVHDLGAGCRGRSARRRGEWRYHSHATNHHPFRRSSVLVSRHGRECSRRDAVRQQGER